MKARLGWTALALTLLGSAQGWPADLRVMSGGAPQDVLAVLTRSSRGRPATR